MDSIKIKDDFIKLGQALKLANLVSSGVEAKIEIENGKVKVNNAPEDRRGRKLYKGDTFTYNGKTIEVV